MADQPRGGLGRFNRQFGRVDDLTDHLGVALMAMRHDLKPVDKLRRQGGAIKGRAIEEDKIHLFTGRTTACVEFL